MENDPGSTMIFLIEHLKQVAHYRKPGYLDDILRSGTVSGEFVELSNSEYYRILKEYFRKGPGDIIAVAATPIAKAIDRMFGTKLAKCERCLARKTDINRWWFRVVSLLNNLVPFTRKVS